jgi:hypothetical protein
VTPTVTVRPPLPKCTCCLQPAHVAHNSMLVHISNHVLHRLHGRMWVMSSSCCSCYIQKQLLNGPGSPVDQRLPYKSEEVHGA